MNGAVFSSVSCWIGNFSEAEAEAEEESLSSFGEEYCGWAVCGLPKRPTYGPWVARGV